MVGAVGLLIAAFLGLPWYMKTTATQLHPDLHNIPSVAHSDTSQQWTDAVVGARWHVTDRLVLRADFTIYTAFASDTRTLEYHATTVGLGLFF